MAVIHVSATSEWFIAAAARTRRHKRLSRELTRAAGRYGHRATISGLEEATALAEAMDDERSREVLQRMEALLLIEANAPRARDIALGRARRRGWIPPDA